MKASKRSPFLTALFNPANLAMLGLIAAASLCAAWWLLPVGLVLWLVMFMLVFYNPTLRFANMIAEREPVAQRFQSNFDRVVKTQISLYQTIAAASRRSRRFLTPIQQVVSQLVAQVYRLSQRMTTLENHVKVSRTFQNPETELSQLEEKITSASNPSVKQDYEAARNTLETNVTELNSMSTLLERFDAQLVSLASMLEGIVAAVVRLRTEENTDLSREVKAVLESVNTEKCELDEFERQIAI